MRKGDIPQNESERLKALYKYEILDTESEKAFDELTELASEICDTPIALISLIDPNRQWFKSRVGLNAEETSRDIAFCAHAINYEGLFEINDTLKDIRFKDNPLVSSDPNIRFYAGAPLITPEGFAIGTICAISDKPKKLNEHQVKAMQILSREVISQLELRQKVKELHEANDRKTEFLSGLSHEMYTPLNSIVSFCQLMLHNELGDIPEQYLTYIKQMDISGKRLLGSVNSIIDICQVEDGNFELDVKSTNVTDLFSYIKTTSKSLALAKLIEVNFKLSFNNVTHIMIDGARLSQVILNLISNSIKFSAAKQAISVNVILNNEHMLIAVKDKGQGIASKDIPFLFQKFQRVANNNKTEGLGVGLVMAKYLVDLMHGDINLTSEPNVGTLVKVKIPITLNRDENDSAAVLKKRFSPDIKILLVEDNVINQEVAKAIFGSIDLKIDIASNGNEGVSKAIQHKYDVIFMDLHLPDFDGFEASRRIIEIHPEQKLVALTADVFAENDPRLLASGIHGVINKPFSINDLIQVINEFS